MSKIHLITENVVFKDIRPTFSKLKRNAPFDNYKTSLLSHCRKFTLSNISALLLAKPNYPFFEDGMLSYVEEENGKAITKPIKDTEHYFELIDQFNHKPQIIKTKDMEKFSTDLTTRIDDFLFGFNALIGDYLFDKFGYSGFKKQYQTANILSIHGFYGSDGVKSFDFHKDPAIVYMIPINVEEGGYKRVWYRSKGVEDYIDIFQNDILIIEEGVEHKVEYFKESEMISLGLERPAAYGTKSPFNI